LIASFDGRIHAVSINNLGFQFDVGGVGAMTPPSGNKISNEEVESVSQADPVRRALRFDL
jgi:hypothetical protein